MLADLQQVRILIMEERTVKPVFVFEFSGKRPSVDWNAWEAKRLANGTSIIIRPLVAFLMGKMPTGLSRRNGKDFGAGVANP